MRKLIVLRTALYVEIRYTKKHYLIHQKENYQL